MWGACFLYLVLFPGILSLVLTRVIITISRRAGFLDRPAERKIHKEPVPLMGGFAVYLAFVITVILHVKLSGLLLAHPSFFYFIPPEILRYLPGVEEVWDKLKVILYGGTVMLLLGVLDDIRDVGAKAKLGVQVLAALMLVLFGIRITLFVDSYFFGAVVTVLWVVGITNAFNLLDNMDGLSGGVAVIAALFFFLTAWMHGYMFIGAVMLVFAGSVLGFLRYNFNPAKIFMGDTGSLFIGYVLAALTILNRYYAGESPTLFPVIMPVLILAVPVFDTLSVICIRLKNGESIFKPDRRHFSHRLLNLGFTQRQAVLLVYLVCFCVGLSSLLLRQVDAFGAVVIIVQALAVFGIIIALEAAGARDTNSGAGFGKE